MSLLSKLEMPEPVASPVFLASSFPFRMLLLEPNANSKETMIMVKYHFTTNKVRSLIQHVNECFNFVKAEKLEEAFYDDSQFSNIQNNVWLKKVTREDSTTLSCNTVKSHIHEQIYSNNEQKMGIQNPTSVDFQKPLLPMIQFTIYRSSYSLKKNDNIKFTYDTVLFDDVRFVVFSISGLVPESSLANISTIHDENLKNKFSEAKCCRSKIVEILFRKRHELDVYESLLDKNYILEDKQYISQDHQFEEFDHEPISNEEFKKRLESIDNLRKNIDWDWE